MSLKQERQECSSLHGLPDRNIQKWSGSKPMAITTPSSTRAAKAGTLNPFNRAAQDDITVPKKRPREVSSSSASPLHPRRTNLVDANKRRRVEHPPSHRQRAQNPSGPARSPSPEFFHFPLNPNEPHGFDQPPVLKQDSLATQRVAAKYANNSASTSTQASTRTAYGEMQDDPIMVDDDDFVEIMPPDDSPYVPPSHPPPLKPPSVSTQQKEAVPPPGIKKGWVKQQAQAFETRDRETEKPAVLKLEEQRYAGQRFGQAPKHIDFRKLPTHSRVADKMKPKNASVPKVVPTPITLDDYDEPEEKRTLRIAAFHLGTLLVEEDTKVVWGNNTMHLQLASGAPRVESEDIKRDFWKMEYSDPKRSASTKPYKEGDRYIHVLKLETRPRPNGSLTIKTHPSYGEHFIQGVETAEGHVCIKFALRDSEIALYEDLLQCFKKAIPGDKRNVVNTHGSIWRAMTELARRSQDELRIVEDSPSPSFFSRRPSYAAGTGHLVPSALQTRPVRDRQSQAPPAKQHAPVNNGLEEEEVVVVPPPPPPRRSTRQTAGTAESSRERERKRPNVDPDEVVLSYPYGLPGAVNVTNADVARLDPGEYLNDTLLEFALKYYLIRLQGTNPDLAQQVHVFSSFFFKKLTEKKGDGLEEGYQSVRKWTKQFDLFAKNYVFVPINENLHWYMALIYRPDRVLKPPSVDEAPEARRQSLRSNKDFVSAKVQAPPPSPKGDGSPRGPAGDEVPPTPSPKPQPRDLSPEPSRSQPFSDGNDEREVSAQLLEDEPRYAGHMQHNDDPFMTFSGHASPGPSGQSSPARHSRQSSGSALPASQEAYSHAGTVGTDDARMGSPVVVSSDDDRIGQGEARDEDGDITMGDDSPEDSKEELGSQEEYLDMSQGMGHMSLGEAGDRRQDRGEASGSSTPDPLLLKEDSEDVSRYPPKPDPISLFDEDNESTLRGPSDDQSPVVHEVQDGETQPQGGGVDAARFYGSARSKQTYVSKHAKSQRAKGKQRAPAEAPSDDIEIKDGAAEPELLRSDQTLVITFDSLGSQHRSAINHLNAYLGLEARDKKQIENVSDVKGKMASVPVQPNFCDCGVYLIHFFRTFLSDPELYLRNICADTKKKSRDHNERKRAWKEQEVGTLRQELREIIRKESEEYKFAKAQKEREKEEAKKMKKTEDAAKAESSDSDIDIVEVSGPPPSVSKAKPGSQGGGRKGGPKSRR